MNRPFGVFDSGIGGLTVLEKLYELMPYENYLYLADEKNLPYGVKEEHVVENIVKNNAIMLEQMGCKMIVIACNTASLFVNKVQKSVNIPVISVIEPTCKNACSTSKNGKIGVIGTQMTIKKGKYQELLLKENKEVFDVPCSEFVDYIENDLNDYNLGVELATTKLSCFKSDQIDTLIYGCTHFSLMEKQIKEVLGDINYISCGTATAPVVKEKLEGLQMENNSTIGSILVYTTGNVNELKSKLSWFKHKIESIKEI